MRQFIYPLISLFILLSACNGETKDEQQTETKACASLDTLFQDVESTEQALSGDSVVWGDVHQAVAELVNDLRTNQQSADPECKFINHHKNPDKNRFHFAELLTEKIISDQQSEPIIHLVELHDIYASDEEISEYFSEKLAIIADKAPSTYAGFITENPDMEQEVMDKTRFGIINSDSLMAKFKSEEQGEPVVLYLEKHVNESEN